MGSGSNGGCGSFEIINNIIFMKDLFFTQKMNYLLFFLFVFLIALKEFTLHAWIKIIYIKPFLINIILKVWQCAFIFISYFTK